MRNMLIVILMGSLTGCLALHGPKIADPRVYNASAEATVAELEADEEGALLERDVLRRQREEVAAGRSPEGINLPDYLPAGGPVVFIENPFDYPVIVRIENTPILPSVGWGQKESASFEIPARTSRVFPRDNPAVRFTEGERYRIYWASRGQGRVASFKVRSHRESYNERLDLHYNGGFILY